MDLDVKTTEMHTGGEPVRIFEANFLKLKGGTLLEKRRQFQEHYDFIRQMLMHEPRGHSDMYGAALVTPDHPDADIGVLFLNNEGYSTMCGHAVIALGRYAVDKGLVTPSYPLTSVNIQCPCGLVRTQVQCDSTSHTGEVSFQSVPAFVFAKDMSITVPDYGDVKLDIAYGGAFYAIISASELGMDLNKTPINMVVQAATAVTVAVRKQAHINHSESNDLAFLYGSIITDGKDDYSDEPTRNICVFADKQVDRSPTGSGVTARIAIQFAKQKIKLGQSRRFESCLGTEFKGEAVEETTCGSHPAVIVKVTGQSYYTGTSHFTAEADDPLAGGFLLCQYQ